MSFWVGCWILLCWYCLLLLDQDHSSSLLDFLAQLSCYLIDGLAVIGMAELVFLLFLAHCEKYGNCEVCAVEWLCPEVWDIVALLSLLWIDMYWLLVTIRLIFSNLGFSIELCVSDSLKWKLVQCGRAAPGWVLPPCCLVRKVDVYLHFSFILDVAWSYLDHTGYGTILIAPSLFTHFFLVQFKCVLQPG